MPVNDAGNHLHGGVNGFNKKLWEVRKIIYEDARAGVELFYRSKDNEEGYPGNVEVAVTYLLTTKNEVFIDYCAGTDKPTIINLINHSYFNLTGFQDDTIYDHELKINAEYFTEKNKDNVPSGKISPVTAALDFTTFKKVGKHIGHFRDDMGYDHNYVLDPTPGAPGLVAELYEPRSNRLLKVFTDRPGIQLYTANWFDGTLSGFQGKYFGKHCSLALETQAFPDAPNHPGFPNTILRKNEVYKTTTVYQLLIA